MSSKQDWLVNKYPLGTVVLQYWLGQQGISHSLTQKYVQHGWLKCFASGVFYCPQNEATEPPSWPALISALSAQTDTKVHLAGLSSLQQQGISHYLVLTSASEPDQTIKSNTGYKPSPR